MLTFKPEPWYLHRKPQEASPSGAMSRQGFLKDAPGCPTKGPAPPSQPLGLFVAHEDG